MAQQWLVASSFILIVALSIAELGSAAPTSGGVRPPDVRSFVFITHPLSKALFLDLYVCTEQMAKLSLLGRWM